ncbi:hypothetical protein [Frankia sp. CiP1_Cm_nod1]|uniref:hypothetical protein n=1 Tax=Frankia sp. CiP1_Cm_nod1 TaxID=2897160 RepID=UPI002023BCD4
MRTRPGRTPRIHGGHGSYDVQGIHQGLLSSGRAGSLTTAGSLSANQSRQHRHQHT